MSQNPGRPDDLTPGRPSDDIDLSEQGGANAERGRDTVDTVDIDEADWEEEERPRGPLQTLLAGLRELVIVIVLAMALSFVVKTWLFQAFYIPSGSMEDTLVRDDRVIVSKLTPGPFDLRRGDVIVFEDPGVPTPWLSGSTSGVRSTLGGPFHDALVYVGLLPEDADNHLIKRVIGLPGDHVQADGTTGKIKVNGVEITEPYIKPGDAPSEGKAFDIVVPAGRVWVMGDHRSDSADSRYHDDGTGRTGSVPIDKIVGRALFVVWPIDHVTWLGVPARTFEQVPTPKATPSVSPTSVPALTPKATKTPTATKAAAG